jgi:uncharacterized protein YbaP (TraB family)
MKRLITAALLGAAAIPAPAQVPAGQAPAGQAPAAQAPLPDADPAMWVVRDADTTIYMFGTFHLLDGKSDWFNDEVRTAFDASQEVVLEAIVPEDPAAIQPLVLKYAVDASGKTLSSKLTPAVKALLDKELAAAKVPAAAFDPLEPWFVAMAFTQIAAQKLGLTGEHGPEAVFTRAAKASGKPVGELEGMEFQLRLFDRMPEAQQIGFLGETLDSMGKMGETLAPMMAAWSSGDTDGLVRIMNEGLDDDPALYDLIFTKRNAAWAEWIDTRLDKPGTVFLAVGAGHLAGRHSVQQALAGRGIASARVAP